MRRLVICAALGVTLMGCQTVQSDAPLPPRRPAGLGLLVHEIAVKHGVPPKIAHGVVMVESRYRCDARNASGATGIMQVLPATARGVGVHGNLRDCRTGAEAGMRYLRQAISRGGSGCAGVSLYERGVYARPVCTGYGRRVLAHAGRSD